MWKNALESPQQANEFARRVVALSPRILSVEIIDEPGHCVGGHVKEELRATRSISKESWRSAGFQNAIFFAGPQGADCEAVVLVRKDEYEVLIQSRRDMMIVDAAIDKNDSITDVATQSEKIREMLLSP